MRKSRVDYNVSRGCPRRLIFCREQTESQRRAYRPQFVSWSACLSVSLNYTSSAILGFFAHQPLPKYPTPLICRCEQGAGSCERVWPRFCDEEFRSSFYFHEFDPCPSKFLPLPIIPLLIFCLYTTLSLPLPTRM